MFVLRHYLDLPDLRQWEAVFRCLSFEREQLYVKELEDEKAEDNQLGKSKSKRGRGKGRGRPRGSWAFRRGQDGGRGGGCGGGGGGGFG